MFAWLVAWYIINHACPERKHVHTRHAGQVKKQKVKAGWKVGAGMGLETIHTGKVASHKPQGQRGRFATMAMLHHGVGLHQATGKAGTIMPNTVQRQSRAPPSAASKAKCVRAAKGKGKVLLGNKGQAKAISKYRQRRCQCWWGQAGAKVKGNV